MKTSILIVEDDKAIQNLLSATLDANSYQCFTAETGEKAIFLATAKNPDILILDLGLPDMDGVELITRIRSWSSCPILVVSARSEDRDKITALDAGADDYLTKPFELEELEARVRALLRRDFAPRSSAVSAGPLTLDVQRREITADGSALPLTRKEFELLEYLVLHPERTVSQEELLDHIWESDSNPFSHSVRMHISSLRKKLRQALGYDPIVTKIGQGYRLEVER